MLHTLGGRFLKRAVPQDANPASFSTNEPEGTDELARQTLPEANRCVRTSAAMLGLAISVGAYGLVAPQQGDAAVAAEPVTSDPSSTDVTASGEVPTVVGSATAASLASSSTHTVQDGQTLWKVAELYGIDAAKLAAMNGLQPNVVLQVGQDLKVPAGNQTATAISGVALKSLPDLKAVPVIPAEFTTAQVEPAGVPAEPVKTVAKAQPSPLQELKQNRNRLKQSLAELKSEESTKESRVAAVPASLIANGSSYQVNPGDTLSSIAHSHGVSVRELANLNRLKNPNLVKANQVIKLPQSASAVSPIQVPTVPSLAVTQSATSSNLPIGIGGDAEQFAFRPGRAGGNNAPAEVKPVVDVTTRSSDQYVNTLMTDIVRLRERYQGRSADRRDTRAATPSLFNNTASRSNADLKPSRQAAALRPQNSNRKPSDATTRLERMLADAPKSRPSVVAAAPIGSESYKPIVRSQVGKTVSPNLPPLGGPENHIPGAQSRGFVWPAKGTLTSGYGWRWGRMHRGIDIAAPTGTPIVAAADGRVKKSGWDDGGYGNLVEIQHPDGTVTRYAHNSSLLVNAGQEVRQGQQIARMGSTGFSTGPHSHFEVHLPGRGAVNPMAHLPQNRS
jgi:murein DD-endopeptidase MepM/ murein hydrolase activator NlpD